MKNLLIIFCFISMAATCQDQNSNSKDKKDNPCDPDIMCTMEFRIINLEIVDEEGNPIALDEFYTEIEDSKVTIEEDLYEAKSGFYPIATDGEMDKLSFEGTEVKFIGVKDGEEIINHSMKIGKDCCHIELLEGEKKLVISL